jgi:hypothetical protein
VIDNDLRAYLILRELGETITRDELDAAAEQSGETLSELRDEGTGIRWIDSAVLTDENGGITGTFCHYRPSRRVGAIRATSP